MRHTEQVVWNQIGDAFKWQCPNIAGYIYDHVEDEGCKGFNLRSLNGVVTIATIGREDGKLQETFTDLELSGDEMFERRQYSVSEFNRRQQRERSEERNST